MHATSRREKFRAVLDGDVCVNPGSVYDALTARMAESLGYEIGVLAGSVASLAILGAPDHVVITLSELAEQCRRMNRAGNLPLLVDADHGYGNALNVRRTVEELETAGVAALTIEDTDLPKPFGTSKARLVSVEEGAAKMKAALDARNDPSLVVVGRTSAPSFTTMADALVRVKAYEDAGVDALMLIGIKTRAELEALHAQTSVPILLVHGGGDLTDLEYLASQGVRVRFQPHLPIQAAMKAAYDTLKALREGTPPADIQNVAKGDLKDMMTRAKDYKTWMKDFLGA
ncbi:MAG: isocitrate lyase/PEP mutase family protein [Rhodospirillales bacterium]